MQFFMQGGAFMWVILILLITDAVMIIKGAMKIFVPGDQNTKAIETNLNSAMWIGRLSVVVGLLGTLLGIYYAAGAISNASDVSTPIVWGGIHVALTTLIFGLWIFVFTIIVVLLLKTKIK